MINKNLIMKIPHIKSFILAFCLFCPAFLSAQQTEKIYLSGTGSDQTVKWKFFCTEGRNSGKWTTIPVPSNWELQGFGKYNYGLDKDTLRGKEKGLYKYTFKVPATWTGKTVDIVFDGSMTDTEVKINGKSAGPAHQGAFYRFRYNITKLLKFGKDNLLEVTVAKQSADESVNKAERHCDYWIFGGIFRPVYLEAFPKIHILKTAVNATADGNFKADVYVVPGEQPLKITAQIFTLNGEKTGPSFGVNVKATDSVANLQAHIDNPLLWSPEFPALYKVTINIVQDGQTIHTVSQRFGFRTVELRQRDGIYVNGTKIKFKGVNRHSFRPSTGRALNKQVSIEDVRLMKDMNMNAVRMSHYPPDDHFLDVCDSLGLFVLDELAGWHHFYDTGIGTKLLKEMIDRDVNHPSIVIWDNGNEGGHNFDLDTVFDQTDIQKRPVIHPWQRFRGTNTQHYIDYDYGMGTYWHGHDVAFPTEFLHGLYDGGAGAGLSDYWELMWNNSHSAGGFLWNFEDEGVVRTDRNGEIDTDGDHAPDGIIGPNLEKEGSYFAIKEIWSPVHFEQADITPSFNGSLNIENQYFYTNTRQCSFSWKLAKLAGPEDKTAVKNEISGTATSPDIQPGYKGKLKLELPKNWFNYDVLYVTATDPYHQELYTWSWPISLPADKIKELMTESGEKASISSETDSSLTVSAGKINLTLDKKTGLLKKVVNEKGEIPFNNGPVICAGIADPDQMQTGIDKDTVHLTWSFKKDSKMMEMTWTVFPSGWVKLDISYNPTDYESDYMGVSFSYPEKEVKAVRWMGDGPYRVWKNRMEGVTLNVYDKAYNNTVTGVPPYNYPEFKGYYSRLYWAKLITSGQPFTVTTSTEDVFLRLYTPQWPKKPANTAPAFPSGDISFMQGIPPIGTKSQKAENMGPSGKKNIYYDFVPYDNWKTRCKKMTLFFDFSGK